MIQWQRKSLIYSPDGMYEPEDVAEVILDGVLRNKREIPVPPKHSRVGLMKLQVSFLNVLSHAYWMI